MTSPILLAAWITSVVLLVILIMKYIKYRAFKGSNQVLSFKAFKSLYNVNPYKWDIEEEEYTTYTYRDSERSCWPIKEKICMKTFIDQLRYSHFVRCQEKQKKREEYNRETERLVKMWQNDIDAYKENAQKEIDDLVSRIEN